MRGERKAKRSEMAVEFGEGYVHVRVEMAALTQKRKVCVCDAMACLLRSCCSLSLTSPSLPSIHYRYC